MLVTSFRTLQRPHWLVMIGVSMGFAAGVAFLFGLPVITAFLIMLALYGLRKKSVASLVAIGGGYMLGSSVWFLPGTEGPIQLFGAIIGTFVIGLAFHGVPHLLLKHKLGWLVWPFAITLSEYLASLLGLVSVPMGLVGLHTPLGGLTTLGSLTVVSIALCSLLVLPLAHRMLLFPTVGLLVACYGAGLPNEQEPLPLKVSYIQHNPSAKTKWQPEVASSLLKELNERTEQFGDADLIVWPENSVTTTFNLETALSQINETKAPLLFGMTRYRENGEPDLVNSAVLRAGSDIQISNKRNLVPIIEDGLGWLKSSAIQRADRQLFTLPNGMKFLALLCYEVSFKIPQEYLDDVSFVVVISAETGLFREMTKQVYDNMAIARSLETGLPILRVGDAP